MVEKHGECCEKKKKTQISGKKRHQSCIETCHIRHSIYKSNIRQSTLN